MSATQELNETSFLIDAIATVQNFIDAITTSSSVTNNSLTSDMVCQQFNEAFISHLTRGLYYRKFKASRDISALSSSSSLMKTMTFLEISSSAHSHTTVSVNAFYQNVKSLLFRFMSFLKHELETVHKIIKKKLLLNLQHWTEFHHAQTLK